MVNDRNVAEHEELSGEVPQVEDKCAMSFPSPCVEWILYSLVRGIPSLEAANDYRLESIGIGGQEDFYAGTMELGTFFAIHEFTLLKTSNAFIDSYVIHSSLSKRAN